LITNSYISAQRKATPNYGNSRADGASVGDSSLHRVGFVCTYDGIFNFFFHIVVVHLAYARSLGDFSENSELDAAKDEQAQVAARISELEELIKNAEIIDDIKADVVNLISLLWCVTSYFVILNGSSP